MKLKVSLPEDEIVAACQNYIEEKLLISGPGWKIECTNSYAFSRALEFEVEAPKAEVPNDQA